MRDESGHRCDEDLPEEAFLIGSAPAATTKGNSPKHENPAEWHWSRSKRFLFAVDLFHHGYYWEAHEVLEPLWIAAGRTSREGQAIQGLIQAAAGLLKVEMGQPRPAARLLTAATARLEYLDEDRFGIRSGELIVQLRQVAAGSRKPAQVDLGVAPPG